MKGVVRISTCDKRRTEMHSSSVPRFRIFVIIKTTKPTVLVQRSLRGGVFFFISRIQLNIEICEEKNQGRLSSCHINELNE